jgi:hypothetical protein
LLPKKVPNPSASREHVFRAWRLKGTPGDPVSLRTHNVTPEITEDEDDNVNS